MGFCKPVKKGIITIHPWNAINKHKPVFSPRFDPSWRVPLSHFSKAAPCSRESWEPLETKRRYVWRSRTLTATAREKPRLKLAFQAISGGSAVVLLWFFGSWPTFNTFTAAMKNEPHPIYIYSGYDYDYYPIPIMYHYYGLQYHVLTTSKHQ